MSKLYQCPYEKACKCNLKSPCLECETFGEFLNAQDESRNVSQNEQTKEVCVRCSKPIELVDNI